MTDWFARPVLHVKDVEASLSFYVNQLGFMNPWRYDEDGRVYVAQVDRQGCALILADTWPEKIGKGLMFISLNVEPATREAAVAALDAHNYLSARTELSPTPTPLSSMHAPNNPKEAITLDQTLLVLLAQTGDRAALEQLLRDTYAPLRRYITRLAGADSPTTSSRRPRSRSSASSVPARARRLPPLDLPDRLAHCLLPSQTRPPLAAPRRRST
jgi:hypothetical protein